MKGNFKFWSNGRQIFFSELWDENFLRSDVTEFTNSDKWSATLQQVLVRFLLFYYSHQFNFLKILIPPQLKKLTWKTFFTCSKIQLHWNMLIKFLAQDGEELFLSLFSFKDQFQYHPKKIFVGWRYVSPLLNYVHAGGGWGTLWTWYSSIFCVVQAKFLFWGEIVHEGLFSNISQIFQIIGTLWTFSEAEL